MPSLFLTPGRAGLDETLDPEAVHILFTAMEPMDEMMRESSHCGRARRGAGRRRRADKLIAFSGRRP